jgi:hypothetical protein
MAFGLSKEQAEAQASGQDVLGKGMGDKLDFAEGGFQRRMSIKTLFRSSRASLFRGGGTEGTVQASPEDEDDEEAVEAAPANVDIHSIDVDIDNAVPSAAAQVSPASITPLRPGQMHVDVDQDAEFALSDDSDFDDEVAASRTSARLRAAHASPPADVPPVDALPSARRIAFEPDAPPGHPERTGSPVRAAALEQLRSARFRAAPALPPAEVSSVDEPPGARLRASEPDASPHAERTGSPAGAATLEQFKSSNGVRAWVEKKLASSASLQSLAREAGRSKRAQLFPTCRTL